MDELFSKSDELSRCLQGLLDLEGNQRLSALMDSISGSVDGRLLNVMESRYYLSTHLSSLKKFMLLGQGDFVTCLMDALGPELKKKASLLYRHNLTGMLEGALRASNAQFEPSFVLERVGVRLLEASAGDTGWEVFALDYIVDAPLSAVVHADAMRKYRSAFFTLWKLKRLEWSLSASWKHLMAFNHMRGSVVVPKLGATLHHCSLSRAFMTHVINNFCAFMQFEVIESAWSTFQSALAQATCLDAVVRAHDAYLADIHKRALLDPVHEALNVQVQLMLQSMLRFCSLEESLVADAIATVSRRRALITDIKARAKGRRSHYVDEEDYDVDDTPSKAEGMTGMQCSLLLSVQCGIATD
jgi:gamma-tubulin complex component 3